MSAPNFNRPEDATLATKCDEIIEIASHVERSGSGPGESMRAQMQRALNRSAATRLVYRHANLHGKVPTGWMGITITTGPIGSGADCTFSWIKTVEEKSFSFKFPEPVINNETLITEYGWDPHLLASNLRSNNVGNETKISRKTEYYLGEYDSNEIMGHNFRTAYWLKLVDANSWEILMLANSADEYGADDEDDENGDNDPEIMSVGVFSKAEVIRYLDDAGVDFDYSLLDV